MSSHVVAQRQVDELIVAAVDGALDPVNLRALHAHLAACDQCASLSKQHERLVQRLASPLPSAAAARLSRQRLATTDQQLRNHVALPFGRLAQILAMILLAVGLATGGFLAITEAVGRQQIPERELVVERADAFGTDRVVLRVEDGRFAAQPGQTSGVVVSADLQLGSGRSGAAELRFAEPGEAYGVLGGAPDLTGAKRVHIENRIPPVEVITTFEIWLHIEGSDPYDSPRVVIRVEPGHGGVRARTP
jgi:Putative zinc-finger